MQRDGAHLLALRVDTHEGSPQLAVLVEVIGADARPGWRELGGEVRGHRHVARSRPAGGGTTACSPVQVTAPLTCTPGEALQIPPTRPRLKPSRRRWLRCWRLQHFAWVVSRMAAICQLCHAPPLTRLRGPWRVLGHAQLSQRTGLVCAGGLHEPDQMGGTAGTPDCKAELPPCVPPGCGHGFSIRRRVW